MSVPEFYRFMKPVLEVMADGKSWGNAAVVNAVIPKIGLSAADLAEKIPSGKRTRVVDRVFWSLTYLRQAKLIETVGRGQNRITARGTAYLKVAPTPIKPTDLTQFPEFAEFQARSNAAEPTAGSPSATLVELEGSTTATPRERIAHAYAEHNEALVSDLLGRIRTMPPERFEALIVQLMIGLGYGGADPHRGEVLGKSGDGGVDGVIREDMLGLDSIYLQAKRWDTRTVGRPDVQAFVGALHMHGATKGVFMTTSTFSQDAIDCAKSLGSLKLSLIDGPTLARLMMQCDLGVAADVTYALKSIDTDFFDVG